MIKVATKSLLILLGVTTGAVLLCRWQFGFQPAETDKSKETATRTTITTTAPQHDEVSLPRSVTSHSVPVPSDPVDDQPIHNGELASRDSSAPTINDRLLQLEREIRRAALIEDKDERQRVLIDACVSCAAHDPADAFALAKQLGLEKAQGAVLENILQQWAQADFPAALTLASLETAGELREQLMSRLAFIHAQDQPSAAARLVEEQIPPGPIQDEAAISVLHQWALRDLNGASAWVDRLPNELKDRARAELNGIARRLLAQR